MHFILAIGCVGMVVVLERACRLGSWLRVDAARLGALVRARVLGGDTAGALRLCAARPSPVARVLHAGVKASVDRARAEAAVREALLEVVPALTRRLPVLSSRANLALLVGLLGTVFGMIEGFSCGGPPVTADQRAAALAKSISIAVNTSGFGLAVAVTLLVARLALVHAAEKLSSDLATCTAKFLGIVAVAREPLDSRASPYRSPSA